MKSLGIRKPIELFINVFPLKGTYGAHKHKDLDELVYVVGNEYRYDKYGNPFGVGVFNSHRKMIEYVYNLTSIKGDT